MSNRSFLVSATLMMLSTLGVVVTTGCAVTPEEENVETSADALTMQCGTTGQSTYGERWNWWQFSTGYMERDSKAACDAAVCKAPTEAQWAASAASAKARGIQWCEEELRRHSCPAGCLLTVSENCVVSDTKESGPLTTIPAGVCTENVQGKWQKDCIFTAGNGIRGVAEVTCGPKGSAPDGGTTDAGTDTGTDAGSRSDTGHYSSRNGPAPRPRAPRSSRRMPDSSWAASGEGAVRLLRRKGHRRSYGSVVHSSRK